MTTPPTYGIAHHPSDEMGPLGRTRVQGAEFFTVCDDLSVSEGRSGKTVLLYAGIMIAITALLRFYTFFNSSLDWDESIYLIIANGMTHGHWPYVTYYDVKPPGIFAIFSVGVWLFREPVFAIRLLSVLAVAGTGVIISLVVARITWRWRLDLLAGLLYCVHTMASGGDAANTELFFLPMTTLAMYLVLTQPIADEKGRPFLSPRLALAGLLFALAIQVKYFAVFDLFAAFVLYSLRLRQRAGNSAVLRGLPRLVLLLAVPSLLVEGALCLLFFANGHFNDFFAATIHANFLNSVGRPFDPQLLVSRVVDQLKTDLLLWSAVLYALFMLLRRVMPISSVRIFGGLLISIGCCLPSILYTRSYNAHYFLHLYPAMCCLAAIAVLVAIGPRPSALASRVRIGLVALIVLVGPVRNRIVTSLSADLVAVRNWSRFGARLMDRASEISYYLAPQLDLGDYLYVVDANPIIYLLTDSMIPTRYPFPPHVIGLQSSRMVGIVPIVELRKIMSKEPRFVVVKHVRPDPTGTDDDFYRELGEFLESRYMFDRAFGEVDIYRRTAGTIPPMNGVQES